MNVSIPTGEAWPRPSQRSSPRPIKHFTRRSSAEAEPRPQPPVPVAAAGRATRSGARCSCNRRNGSSRYTVSRRSRAAARRRRPRAAPPAEPVGSAQPDAAVGTQHVDDGPGEGARAHDAPPTSCSTVPSFSRSRRDTLVLSHVSAPLPSRLNEARNVEIVTDALEGCARRGLEHSLRGRISDCGRARRASSPASCVASSQAPPRRRTTTRRACSPRPSTRRPGHVAIPRRLALELLQSELGARRIDGSLGRPPRSQGEATVAALVVELDGQNLVQLNDVRLEAQPRAGHVQAPHLAPSGRPTSSTASSQCSTRFAAPVPQRHRVVLAQVLLVDRPRGRRPGPR